MRPPTQEAGICRLYYFSEAELSVVQELKNSMRNARSSLLALAAANVLLSLSQVRLHAMPLPMGAGRVCVLRRHVSVPPQSCPPCALGVRCVQAAGVGAHHHAAQAGHAAVIVADSGLTVGE